MKLNITSMQNPVSDLESNSAFSKTQKANAERIYGSKGEKVLKLFDFYIKQKMLDTTALETILDALNSKDPRAADYFDSLARTTQGKNMAKRASALNNAKTPEKIFEALKVIRPNSSMKEFAAGVNGQPYVRPSDRARAKKGLPPLKRLGHMAD